MTATGAGSLLPLSDADHKFLQIYFMGNTDVQIDQHSQFNMGTKGEIVAESQTLFTRLKLNFQDKIE